MSLKARIVDGEGSQQEAGITNDNAIKVSIVPINPNNISEDVLTRTKLYRDRLVDSGGLTNMAVDGSVTSKTFYASAIAGYTTYVVSVRFILNATKLNIVSRDAIGFGSAYPSGLTNGIELEIIQRGENTNFFDPVVKKLSDFFDYASSVNNFPGTAGPNIDFLSFDFDFDSPIILVGKSLDKVSVVINDNLTTFSSFEVIIHGYKVLL